MKGHGEDCDTSFTLFTGNQFRWKSTALLSSILYHPDCCTIINYKALFIYATVTHQKIKWHLLHFIYILYLNRLKREYEGSYFSFLFHILLKYLFLHQHLILGGLPCHSWVCHTWVRPLFVNGEFKIICTFFNLLKREVISADRTPGFNVVFKGMVFSLLINIERVVNYDGYFVLGNLGSTFNASSSCISLPFAFTWIFSRTFIYVQNLAAFTLHLLHTYIQPGRVKDWHMWK